MEFVSKSEKETEKLAQILAKEIIKKPLARKAAVIGLEGKLGAGKTVFVRGFAKGLKLKEKITSPTFVLLKVYPVKVGSEEEKRFLFHIDSYRLKNHRDLLALGAKEVFGEPRNLVLVEWCDRVTKALPEKYIKVHIDHFSKKTRKILIQK